MFLWERQGHGNAAWILLVMIFVLLAGVIMQIKFPVRFSFFNIKANLLISHQLEHFILHSSGQCSFDESSDWQLLPTSRIGMFGVWLNLKIIDKNELVPKKKVFKKLFIFKDSVSSKDFSRIARITYFIKSQSPQEK